MDNENPIINKPPTHPQTPQNNRSSQPATPATLLQLRKFQPSRRFSNKTYIFVKKNPQPLPPSHESPTPQPHQSPVTEPLPTPTLHHQQTPQIPHEFKTPQKKSPLDPKISSTAGTTGQVNSLARMKPIIKGWRKDRYSRRFYYFQPREMREEIDRRVSEKKPRQIDTPSALKEEKWRK